MNRAMKRTGILLLAALALVALLCFGGMVVVRQADVKAEEEQRTLIAHYACEDLTGYDEAAKIANVSFIGELSLSEGFAGNGWSFGGSEGVTLNDTPDLSGDFTVEFRFKTDALPSGTQLLVGKNNYSGNDKREWTLAVQTETSTQRMYIAFNAWNPTKKGWDVITSFVSVGEWHGVSLEVSGGIANLFVDNGCVGGISFAERANTAAQFTIGHGINGTNAQQYFNGMLDEIKIYTGTEARDSMRDSMSSEGLALRYSFERSSDAKVADASGNENDGSLYPAVGKATANTSRIDTGYRENGVYLNGKNIVRSDYSIDVSKDFAVSLYFYAEKLAAADQVVFGQANYGTGQREFAMYITSNGNLRLNAWVNGAWKSAIVGEISEGRWYHFALSVSEGVATGWLNGFEAFRTDISDITANTGAVFTVGGVVNNTGIYQMFDGYFDEVRVYGRALSEEEIWQSLQDDIGKTEREVQHMADESIYSTLKTIPGTEVDFISIQKSDLNGYKWQHGGAIAFYDGKFFAVWGRNKGEENTAGEECVCYTSEDGINWEYNATLGDAVEGFGYSHGSIFVVDDTLYVMAPFYAGSDGASSVGIHFKELVMRGFEYDRETGWKPLDFETPDFWPLQQPQKMADGNYIMAGVDGDWRSAVAVSDGNDMTSWKVIKIPQLATGFTESNLVVEGDTVTIYMRNQKAFDAEKVTIGVSYSKDCGKTWTIAQETDMSACTSKPCVGTLSTGERYLITNSLRGANNSRNTLTIALTAEGGEVFERLYVIRDMAIPDSLKEAYSDMPNGLNTSLSYPFAMEKDGKLYVIYSSYAYPGTTNYNNIELAIIDLSYFEEEREAQAFAEKYMDVLSSTETTAEELRSINGEYQALKESVKSQLKDFGFSAKLETALSKVAAQEKAREVEEKVAEILRLIEGASAGTLTDVGSRVAAVWNTLDAQEKALVLWEDLQRIETFIGMACISAEGVR